ncbi:hypothetical protein IV203_008887 [Nitzschia inconspicua]|uniref:Uncharacterized protein n=1 Tax=Nitzschia inconspicua TaxID=303405 RepID=A0A9K3L0F7_9STRA|nr:hypothetical protein IV203_008887 [Nitzschia inconspicua]
MSNNRAPPQDEESAKELRKIFPLPVLRHDHGAVHHNTGYPMPYQHQHPNQINTEITVPDDFTYVSELTSPEETYPNEIPTTKSLTSQNLRALESGQILNSLQAPPNMPTPKTFPYQSKDDDDEDAEADNIPINKWNAEDFSYNGEEDSKPRGKLMCLIILFVLLVIAAAVGIGVGVGVSESTKKDSSAIVDVPTGPPIEIDFPTSAPSVSPTGIDTDSPDYTGSPAATSAPTITMTAAPTVSPETTQPGPTPTLAPSAATTTPAPIPAPTIPATSAPTFSPTQPPVATPTAPPPVATPAPTAPPPVATPAPTEGAPDGCVNQVTAIQSCFTSGSPIDVSFNVCSPDPNGEDWIGIYRDTGDLISSSLGEPRYWESSCVTSECRREPYSGLLPVGAVNLSEGTYKVFLVSSDDSDTAPYRAFATGNTFQVSDSC